MNIHICEDSGELARRIARDAAAMLRRTIDGAGRARILVDAAAEQREMFAALVIEAGVTWAEVELYHTHDYAGLNPEHPGTRRRRLFDWFIAPTRLGRYHLLETEHDLERACRDEGASLAASPIDLALLVLGDQAQLAFNEPPADFHLEKPYVLIRLDEGWRRREAGGGGFTALAEVPERAISISIRQLLKAKTILCMAPGAGKADAVKRSLEGTVSPLTPASILQTHPDVTLYLDRESSALLSSREPNTPA